ncbi:MAG: NUDIX hydrolase [Ignavibacteriaceae bacterium]
MKNWKRLSLKTVLDHSKFFKLEFHEVVSPSGKIISDWPWIILPDYANIIAVTKAGKYLCFRQDKYSYNGTSLAPVGGYIDPGEDPLTAAKRELEEETGYRSENWIELGKFVCDGNRGCGNAYFFLALDAEKTDSDLRSDDLELQELIELDKDEIKSALLNNEFKVLGWATAVSIALHYSGNNLPDTA